MLLKPLGFFHNPPAGGGGGSGSFTFTVPNSKTITSVNDPGSVTLGFTATEGNLLVCIAGDRSSNTLTTYDIGDNGTGTSWTKHLELSNAVGGNEAATRANMVVFTRPAVASGNEAGLVTVTDSGNLGKFVHIFEIQPSATYGFNGAAGVITGSGAANIDGLTSGSVSPTGDDILEIAMMLTRNGTAPTLAGVSFNSPHTTGKTGFFFGNNSLGAAAAITGTSTAAGSKTATVNADGSASEGIIALLTFRDSA